MTWFWRMNLYKTHWWLLQIWIWMFTQVSKTLENEVVPYGYFGFCDHGIISMCGGTYAKAYDGFITNKLPYVQHLTKICFQIIMMHYNNWMCYTPCASWPYYKLHLYYNSIFYINMFLIKCWQMQKLKKLKLNKICLTM